ncbi:nucleotide exchange factor GrpE [Cohnella lubricantis]|uniref:Protein GrpE n=1 Tax=Cohnella lubricantis TaxID=2163172 RepID=A0A841T939_9BACL|nr:nucleotide exchange factor GrpE [Cohnella lubricantis]MBB6675760.1 nucleotide exchange factor GrpE [Cohnella lubricantis]
MTEEQREAEAAANADAQAEEANAADSAAAETVSEEAAEATESEDPRMAELRQQAEEYNNRYLRAQADFDNFRRRTLKEKEELAQYASMKLITQLLPVVDNFGRALQTSSEQADGQSFQKGVDMIYRQLTQVLEAEGLKAMEPVGQPFDPEVHQAIMQVESDEYEEGIVVEVVQPGYWLKDKVIRPAMVKVSG